MSNKSEQIAVQTPQEKKEAKAREEVDKYEALLGAELSKGAAAAQDQAARNAAHAIRNAYANTGSDELKEAIKYMEGIAAKAEPTYVVAANHVVSKYIVHTDLTAKAFPRIRKHIPVK